MLTDPKLKNLKATGRPFKIADRDGLYAQLSAVGGISFRYNYRLNGRQETVVLGRYGVGGMTLHEAREALAGARKAVGEGISPARTPDATWSEIDFEHALWSIPGGRMKRRNPHNVYLPRQVSVLLR